MPRRGSELGPGEGVGCGLGQGVGVRGHRSSGEAKGERARCLGSCVENESGGVSREAERASDSVTVGETEPREPNLALQSFNVAS